MVNALLGGAPNYFNTFSGTANKALDAIGAGKAETAEQELFDNVATMVFPAAVSMGGAGANLLAKGGEQLLKQAVKLEGSKHGGKIISATKFGRGYAEGIPPSSMDKPVAAGAATKWIYDKK